jgi:hypothetical protein
MVSACAMRAEAPVEVLPDASKGFVVLFLAALSRAIDAICLLTPSRKFEAKVTQPALTKSKRSVFD